MATATLFRGTEPETRDDLDDVPARIGRSSLLWLDVSRTRSELQRAADLSTIDEETIRQVVEGNQSPDIEDRPSYTRITTRVPKRTSQNAQLAEVDCIVGERWVVTVHDEPVAVLEDFRERANGSGAIGRP